MYFPLVTTVSLGSATLLEFSRHRTSEGRLIDPQLIDPAEKFNFLLEPRSLLILKGSLYTQHMHGIAERVEDDLESDRILNLMQCDEDLRRSRCLKRTSRISLTIRHVPRLINSSAVKLLSNRLTFQR